MGLLEDRKETTTKKGQLLQASTYESALPTPIKGKALA